MVFRLWYLVLGSLPRLHRLPSPEALPGLRGDLAGQLRGAAHAAGGAAASTGWIRRDPDGSGGRSVRLREEMLIRGVLTEQQRRTESRKAKKENTTMKQH